jgi:hypothetical protein
VRRWPAVLPPASTAIQLAATIEQAFGLPLTRKAPTSFYIAYMPYYACKGTKSKRPTGVSYNTVILLLIFASCVCANILPPDHPWRKNDNSYVVIDEDEMIVYNTDYLNEDGIGKTSIYDAIMIAYNTDYRSKEKIGNSLYFDIFYFHMIYAKYLNSGSLFTGKIIFKIEIEASGNISQISIISSSTNNPEFDDELKNYIKKICRFKSIEKGNFSVIVPFVFITIPLL